MKFHIKDFFSKCDQICSFLRIWSHLIKKSLIEISIFCAVLSLLIQHLLFFYIKHSFFFINYMHSLYIYHYFWVTALIIFDYYSINFLRPLSPLTSYCSSTMTTGLTLPSERHSPPLVSAYFTSFIERF